MVSLNFEPPAEFSCHRMVLPLFYVLFTCSSRGSSVGTGWTTGIRFSTGARKVFLFCLRHLVQTGFGAHNALYPLGTWVYLPDNSPPSCAEVKNAWNYTSTLAYVFMACYKVKHKDNFTFLQL
jgi:hypothetical protein